MARYTGPTSKKARALWEPIFGFDKAFEKKKYAPGQHGNSRKRKQKSDYANQLMEKQKAKYTYGVLERQFRNLFEKSTRKKGTAKKHKIGSKKVEMAGKTGTVQVVRITEEEREKGLIKNEDIPWKKRDHALFVIIVFN